MKYRGKDQIIFEILKEMMEKPITKTRIMYRACLSYTQVKSYVDVLEKTGLIHPHNGLYMITEKGKNWLDAFHKLNSILSTEDLTT